MGEMIFVIFHLADSFSPQVTFFFRMIRKLTMDIGRLTNKHQCAEHNYEVKGGLRMQVLWFLLKIQEFIHQNTLVTFDNY